MKHVDVAIVGAGLAGSMSAVMLGRAGVDAVLIDPRKVYPPDFRCEKLDRQQIELLGRTGVSDVVFSASSFAESLWITRYGRLVDRRPNDQCDFTYDAVVNRLRAAVPAAVPFIEGKVTKIVTSDDRQSLALSGGGSVSARLVVLASGLNFGLRSALGIERQIISPAHSVSIGFNMAPVGRRRFDFPSLTAYAEKLADRVAYLTLFPIGPVMRANLFVYRDMDDPWLMQMKRQPVETLFKLLPSLRRLTGDIEIEPDVRIRPVDLYVSSGHRQPGVVLAGDAFSTSCPAAGTGASKVFTDVDRLCNHHIPAWLTSPGMGVDKVAAYYDDPVREANEAACLEKALWLKSMSLEAGLAWRARRLARFAGHMALGHVRRLRAGPGVRPADGGPALPKPRSDAA